METTAVVRTYQKSVHINVIIVPDRAIMAMFVMRQLTWYYDPVTFRMLSQDSYRGEKTDPGSWNLYVYCAENPINYTDPTGHKPYPRNYKKTLRKSGEGTVAVGLQIIGGEGVSIWAAGFGAEIVWPIRKNGKISSPKYFIIYQGGHRLSKDNIGKRISISGVSSGTAFAVKRKKGNYRFDSWRYVSGLTVQVSANYKAASAFTAWNKYYFMAGIGVGKSTFGVSVLGALNKDPIDRKYSWCVY